MLDELIFGDLVPDNAVAKHVGNVLRLMMKKQMKVSN
jgi:hypothetical protein